ncbi:DUF4389 domain-containing protein [Reichenbachiella sp. MSK19-1]|uniref:DUF4389 domain-containing protein n=1 Tax=Reichenbachiella sp. MSK19-1 TaxID=1897631 RepID=UPI000E6B5E4E|nr:DUF4389 domain-containing protein [Reichenbachiella sp. MSK19-1]RJE74697.1 hypothetical protein BGP76_16315 [Reichenbachiella sp. MSK19-1]
MTFEVKHQDSYSRGELLLRSFFGMIYIGFPHAFILLFLGLWGQILSFITFWVILFTGSYPESFFEYQLKLIKWSTRVNLRLYNMADGYPSFGLESEDEAFQLEVPYSETTSRSSVLVRFLFGWLYVVLPHIFVLIFRSYATMFLMFLAFFSVLFTGNYPESWFRFNVGTLRWGIRINLYLSYMTDTYPPFSGK